MPETDNGIVYHYCSLEAFKSIIENKCLWLCDVQKSNDSAECTYFENIMINHINYNILLLTSNYNHDDNRDRKIKALQLLKESLHNSQTERATIYSCSFSYNGDQLSQWRGYADDGYGIAIGFSDYFFVRQLPHGTFNRVLYGQGHANSTCEKILQKAFLSYEHDKNGENDPDYTTTFVLNVLEQLDRHNIFFKSDAFIEENECRVVMRIAPNRYSALSYDFLLRNPHIDPNDTTLNFSISTEKYRIAQHTFSSYIELSFDKIKDLLINSITLGPKCQADPKDIRQFLRICGYNTDDIIIKRSFATYR